MNSPGLRWLCPRFSISNLLMLMVIIGLALALHIERRKGAEQAQLMEAQRRENMRLTVNGILRLDALDAQKAAALQPLVKLGQSIETLEPWCGPRIPVVPAGPGDGMFRFAECDLVVECDAAGVIRSLGYQRWKVARCEVFQVYVAVARDAPPMPPGESPPAALSQRPDAAGGMR